MSLFILIVAIIARVKINKANASDTPGMFQNIIELVIEMLGSMVDGIMGRNANRFVNYKMCIRDRCHTGLWQETGKKAGKRIRHPGWADSGRAKSVWVITGRIFGTCKINRDVKRNYRHHTVYLRTPDFKSMNIYHKITKFSVWIPLCAEKRQMCIRDRLYDIYS